MDVGCCILADSIVLLMGIGSFVSSDYRVSRSYLILFFFAKSFFVSSLGNVLFCPIFGHFLAIVDLESFYHHYIM